MFGGYLIYTLAHVFRAFVISLFLVSLFNLQASISVKFLIFSIVFFCFYTYQKIKEIFEKQSEQLYFLRNIYISLETSRLDPEDKQPSKDILKKHLEIEQASKLLFPNYDYYMKAIPFYTYLLGFLFFIPFFIKHWDFITSISIFGAIKKLLTS